MGMDRPILGLPALSSVCGYVRSFSRYGRKRVSPSVGVALFHDDSYEYKCSMVPRNEGNYQPHAWATYTFIRLWLCAMVREKMTEKWLIFWCPPRCGEHKGVEHGKKNATTS